MPDTFQEDEFKGHPIVKIYVGSYKGEDLFLTLGLKKAKAVIEHYPQLVKWVEDQENR